MKTRAFWLGVGMVAVAAAQSSSCGGKAVIDGARGSGGAGGKAQVQSSSATTTSTVDQGPFTAAGPGATSGTGANCDNLAMAYASAVAAAKSCSPAANGNPCTGRVAQDVTECCPPDTSIDDDPNALAKVKQAQAAYQAAGCAPNCVGQGKCTPQMPLEASCFGEPSGLCQDSFSTAP